MHENGAIKSPLSTNQLKYDIEWSFDLLKKDWDKLLPLSACTERTS